MRKIRLGAALIAVVLLLQLLARSGSGPRAKINIENQQNNIGKNVEYRVEAPPSQRLRDLAAGLRTVQLPSEKGDNVAAPTASAAAVAAGDRALPPVLDPDWSHGKFAHFSAEELAAMADRCELRWQLPPFATVEPSPFGVEYDRQLDDARRKFHDGLVALYRQSGGGDGDTLPLPALQDALRRAPTDDDEAVAAHRRLAGERAGDPATGEGSVYERYLRLSLAAGDDFERALTASAGATQARAWRDAAGPKLTLSGCDREHAVFRSTR